MSKLASDNVEFIFATCQESFAKHGLKLSFPKNTNPAKTYLWKYVQKISEIFDKYNLDEDAQKRYLSIAAEYLKNSKTNNFSYLLLPSTVQKCLERLLDSGSKIESTLQQLADIHTSLKAQSINTYQDLLRRPNFFSASKITQLYSTQKITPLYMALSVRCLTAIHKLGKTHESERFTLPSSGQLYLLRQDFLEDKDVKNKVKQILGNDLVEGV